MNYSELLKEYRIKNVLTQAELAKQIGIARKTLCQLEKKKLVPSILLQGKINRFLKI